MRTERGLHRRDPAREITELDELGAGSHDRGEGPVPGDRVLEPERLHGDRLEEYLIVFDRAQAPEAVDRGHGAFLAPVEPAHPARLGELLGGVGGVPEAERLVEQRGGPTRPTVGHLVRARSPYHRLPLVGRSELVGETVVTIWRSCGRRRVIRRLLLGTPCAAPARPTPARAAAGQGQARAPRA